MEEIKKEPVTILLILLNALIFLIVEITGGSENGQHMLECGAVYAPLIFEQGQWYRMFTSMFLHFGAPHLINNMLFFDMQTEKYTLSAGASGAVFVVMGGMIYVIIRHRGKVSDLTIRQMLIMAAFSLYFGFASEGVDNIAHIGGLLCGFLTAVIFYHPRKIWKTVP